MDDYVAAINAYRPKCIYGYASSVALLRGARARAVIAEIARAASGLHHRRAPLPAPARADRGGLGAPVANEFGSRDIGFTAHEDSRGEMPLMSESIILEVLDDGGQPGAAGRLGRGRDDRIVSRRRSRSFVTARVTWSGSPTALPPAAGDCIAIAEIAGRTSDFVVRSDGTIMHALAVIYVMRATEGVAEFKLIQHTPTEVEVLVVPDARWCPASAVVIDHGLKARPRRDLPRDPPHRGCDPRGGVGQVSLCRESCAFAFGARRPPRQRQPHESSP